jgi:hypothetical protein
VPGLERVYCLQITYLNLYNDLSRRAPVELSMAVQAVFQENVHGVRVLRYDWAEDGTVVLTLDCHPRYSADRVLTFADLLKELQGLCPWQLAKDVVIGIKTAFVEVLTVYHEFDLASRSSDSLMLICTPPDEYFEFTAA